MNRYSIIRPDSQSFKCLLNSVLNKIKTAAKLEYAQEKDLDTFKKIMDSNQLFYYVQKEDKLNTILFSRYKDTVDLLVNLTQMENKGDNISTIKIASILGYPDCCAKEFIKARGDDEKAIINTIENSTRFHPLLNNIEIEKDFIQFFPCSYECAPALDFASYIKENNQDTEFTIDYISRGEYKRINPDEQARGKRLEFRHFSIDERQLDIVLGYRCNTSCYHCFSIFGKNHMSREEVLSTIKKYSEHGYKRISFNGGEPTIDKNIKLYGNFARKHGFNEVKLKTNGMMLSYTKFMENLRKAGFTHISISILGKENEYYKLNPRQDMFRLVSKAIDNLSSYPFHVEAEYLMHKHNENKILSHVSELYDRGITSFNLWLITTHHLESDELQPDVSTIIQEIKKTISYCIPRGIKLRVLHLPPCLFGKSYRPFVKQDEEEDVRIVTPGKSFHITEESFAEYVKKEECKECIYNNSCPGFRKEYSGNKEWINAQPIK